MSDLELKLDGAGSAKCCVLVEETLPSGRHRIHIEAPVSEPGTTFVVAVPMAGGCSNIEVTIEGLGRFDLGFWLASPGAAYKEYRFSLLGPVHGRTLEVDMDIGRMLDAGSLGHDA